MSYFISEISPLQLLTSAVGFEQSVPPEVHKVGMKLKDEVSHYGEMVAERNKKMIILQVRL
tara:strand:- start:1376 stop:1558 length:183 start_codon:yes stop_codon:yes gene_type:complete